MRKGDLCHYWNSAEDHSIDLRPCGNCEIPVCARCRIDGFCLECNSIRGEEGKLLFRAVGMGAFYEKIYKMEDSRKTAKKAAETP